MDKQIKTALKSAEKQILTEKYKTALLKTQFINDIKLGLGEEIKKNAGKVTVHKLTWYQKLESFLKKLFTKF